MRMEDLWRRNYSFPSEQPSSCHAGPCLSDYQIRTPINSIKYGEPGTCTDIDHAPAAMVFDTFAIKSALGRASSGPVAQIHQSAENDFAPAVTQKFATNICDQAQTLTCNPWAESLLNSCNPLLRPTRNHRRKKASGGGGHDHLAGRVCTENGHVHKLVERHRRKTMRTLCLTLTSLLPEEYQKTKHGLSDQLLEAIKYIYHLQNALLEIEKKRDELRGTVQSFSKSSCLYRNLQAYPARPSNVPETFPTIRVTDFGSGIQVTANTFKNQIDFSGILTLLEDAGFEVVSATVSAINDRVFYSIHSKFSEFLHFDSAVIEGRIDQLMKDNLPSNSLIK